MKTDKKIIIAISFLVFIFSFIFVAIKKEWIILNFASKKKFHQINKTIEKKEIKIYFFKNNKFNFEDIDIIWNKEGQNSNIFQIASNWINILEEENILTQKIVLQDVFIHKSNIYLSFDSRLFNPQWSIEKKLKIIKSLKKTLKPFYNNYKLYFMVHYNQMPDEHLNL